MHVIPPLLYGGFFVFSVAAHSGGVVSTFSLMSDGTKRVKGNRLRARHQALGGGGKPCTYSVAKTNSGTCGYALVPFLSFSFLAEQDSHRSFSDWVQFQFLSFAFFACLFRSLQLCGCLFVRFRTAAPPATKHSPKQDISRGKTDSRWSSPIRLNTRLGNTKSSNCLLENCMSL